MGFKVPTKISPTKFFNPILYHDRITGWSWFLYFFRHLLTFLFKYLFYFLGYPINFKSILAIERCDYCIKYKFCIVKFLKDKDKVNKNVDDGLKMARLSNFVTLQQWMRWGDGWGSRGWVHTKTLVFWWLMLGLAWWETWRCRRLAGRMLSTHYYYMFINTCSDRLLLWRKSSLFLLLRLQFNILLLSYNYLYSSLHQNHSFVWFHQSI